MQVDSTSVERSVSIPSKRSARSAFSTLAWLCLLMLSFRTVASCQSLYDSGNEFIRVCSAADRIQGHQSAQDKADVRACESYVVGVEDGVEIQHTWSMSHGDDTAAAFCVNSPQGKPDVAKVRAVLRYARENPDRAAFRSVIVVEEALHKEFPCK